ncbi:MAG: hypothetical protein COT35_06790 [Nitrospirae bacterium CG08_land_8_20_14_0_20_52_24]|nr:MAG: hypothetical protein COT35_06790 [Nitrospirae bacterium CG08_land_8_20_14_0_20_52_24]PIV85764.1 MAG: hypothetical protein COW52_00510 [Nitrospirae bacterium CG17_big_fil_post_rev_8_21_14_2_50_50_9]
MAIGWFKKRIIQNTTREVIRGIVKATDITLRINPGLNLEEALRFVNKERGMFYPNEEKLTTDLYGLFSMMVLKAYRYKRPSDIDALLAEHSELILKIAWDYMDKVLSKSKDDLENLIN